MKDMKVWESKAKRVYSDSVKILKEGFRGFEVMAGKTVEVTKIKLANQKALVQIQALFTEMGQRVFDPVLKNPKGTIKVTPDLASYAHQIQSLQENIEKNLERLSRATTVIKEKKKTLSHLKKRKVK